MRPHLGLAAWVWISLIAPANWAFGFSRDFRLSFTIGIVVCISYMFMKNKPSISYSKIHLWMLLFGFWMLISTIFHNQVDSGFVWGKFIEFLKMFTLFWLVCLICDTPKKIDTIVWAIILSIPAYAGMEAVKFLLSAGGHKIVGVAGIIADRNDLAVAINMCLPLIIYLIHRVKSRWFKIGLSILFILNLIAIIGTFSRGGFVGLSLLLLFWWLRSNYKMALLILALICLPVVSQIAPEDWKQRQATIQTATTQDGSFIGRLWAWKIATLIAIDDPLTGAGFKGTSDPLLWNLYAPETPLFGYIETPPIPSHLLPKAAHNIYFQVLATSGFVGLFIFVIILWNVAFMAFKYKNSLLLNAILLSMIGYGVTGMNVSLAYFQLVYILFAIVCVVSRFEQAKLKRHKNGADSFLC